MTRKQRLQEGSLKRREQQKVEVSEAILKAAGELFLKYGYDGFSLRQVAESIGYSPGTIYLYFDDKDDLLRTLANQGFAEFAAALESAVAPLTDPLERLIALGRAYITFGLQNRAFYRLMFMERPDFFFHEDAQVAPNWQAAFALWTTALEGAVQMGKIRAGDPQKTGDAIMSLLYGIVALANRMPDFTVERALGAADVAIEMIVNGLRP